MDIFYELETENELAQLFSLKIIGGKKIISFARRKVNIFKEKLKPVVLNRIKNFPRNEILILVRDILISYLKDNEKKINHYLNFFEKIVLNTDLSKINFFHYFLDFINLQTQQTLDLMLTLNKEKLSEEKEYTPTVLRHYTQYVDKKQIKAHVYYAWNLPTMNSLESLRLNGIVLIDKVLKEEIGFKITKSFTDISSFLV